MYKIYDKWPEIARESFKTNQHLIDLDKKNHIVFAGMGGSGAIGNVFASILSKSNIHVSVVKGYLLPKTVDSETLVITTSISGNTVETLSILDSAYKQGSNIVAFSSGGKMQEYCEKNKVKHFSIPKVHSPRASFVSFLYSILNVLHFNLDIKQSDIIESIKGLEDIKKNICSLNLTESNPSLKLAEWIVKTPVIYYPFGLQAAAIRFKNSLQENAKMHCSAEDIIEFCHNGIVSWETPNNFQPIMIQGVDDHIKTKERWNIVEKFFLENEIEFWKISSTSGSILTKIINLIYLLDFATIYKSTLNGIDPSPVKSIDYIKNNLNA